MKSYVDFMNKSVRSKHRFHHPNPDQTVSLAHLMLCRLLHLRCYRSIRGEAKQAQPVLVEVQWMLERRR